MWANAQRDGRRAEYRWRPLFNAAVWLTPTTIVPCSNAAKTRNPLKFAWAPQTTGWISAVSRPKFTILWGHLEEILMLNKFFFGLSSPLPSNRHNLSNCDCLEGKRENYQVCSAQQLCTVQCTHI